MQKSLRNLYFVRTLVQIVWASIVISTAATQPKLGGGLLILYPLWDVACTFYDLNSDAGARGLQLLNALLGLLTAVGIGLTVFTQPIYAVAVFGVWALVAGLLQLAAGVQRRKEIGGQWPMILSGAQSTAAGAAFILGGLAGKLHIQDLGGYAVFGAIYFLIGGILLGRKAAQAA